MFLLKRKKATIRKTMMAMRVPIFFMETAKLRMKLNVRIVG
jgi:hypothetical protein